MSKYLFRSAMAVSLAAVALAFALPARAEEKAGTKTEKPSKHDFTGTIESMDAAAGTVKIKNKKEESKTFSCDAACKYRTNDKKEAAMSDFKVGDKVTAHYTEEEGGKLVCHKLEQPKPKKATEEPAK
jgi:Cu/Ag efflux protein CusF